MSFDRRHFLGLSLAAATAPALGQTSLLHLLTRPDAVAAVEAILREHLQVGDAHKDLIKRFTVSLQSSLQHTESPEVFQELLQADADADLLANYVIQEFVIATNYLACLSKEEPVLRLLA